MSSSMPKQTKNSCLKGGTSLSLARGGNQYLETASSLHLRAMLDGRTKKTLKSFSDKKVVSAKPPSASVAAKARSRFPSSKSKPLKNVDVLSGGSLKDAPTFKKKPPGGGALERLAQAVALTQPNQRTKISSKPSSNNVEHVSRGPLKKKKKKLSDPPSALQHLAHSADLLARSNKRPKIYGKENPLICSMSVQLPPNTHPTSHGSSLLSSQRQKAYRERLSLDSCGKSPKAPKDPTLSSTESLASTPQEITKSAPIKLQDFDFLSDGDNASTQSVDTSLEDALAEPARQPNPKDLATDTLSLGVNNRAHKKKITFASSTKGSNSTWKSLLQPSESSAPSTLRTYGNATNFRDDTAEHVAKNEKSDPMDVEVEDNKPQNLSVEDGNNNRNGLEALAPIPVPEKGQDSLRVERSENFVKLNMRNKAGSCRGARNKKGKTKSQIKWENQKRDYQQTAEYQSSSMCAKQDYSVASGGALTHDGVDPVDDLLDGAYATKAKASNALTMSLPLCSGHRQPCKQLRVKKASSGNKGREFFFCALPRGEQCNYFKWVDDTKEAVQKALMKNKSYSGFVARQVQSYMESIKEMTVPELQDLARKRCLPTTGKKKEILMRLSLWTRNELINASAENDDNSKFTETDNSKDLKENQTGDSCCSDDDSISDSDASDEELEISGLPPRNHDAEQTNPAKSTRVFHTKQTEKNRETNHLDCHKALKRYFGFSSFRPGQEWAIRRCLERKRSLLVAPTGSGKSLCYALPAAMMEGVCIVVSPLLSLIQDQIRVLPPSIPSASLSGQMSTMKMAATLDDISKCRQKIVFVSPEKLTSASFRRLFIPRWNRETNRNERFFPAVSLLCIDECHVLSQWGHNFRPSYLRLKTMVDMICPESILAITATAGPLVVADVCESLGITQKGSVGREVNQSVSDASDSVDSNGVQALESNRDNIEVACAILSSQEDRIARLISLLKPSGTKSRKCMADSVFGSGSIIVYVWRQRDAEAVAENLNSAGIQGGVCVYHGGMESSARATAQNKFLRQKARVCVATVAFGLGINAPFVEGIIHMYLPPSPENYLQEIGRAGRDGRQAFAMALVLQEEVLVRHSLAHTDSIALSQVNALLRLLCKKTEVSLSKLGDKPNQLSIGILTNEAVAACGFKAETVETLLSLLEAGLLDKSYLRIDGFFYDRATLAPRRCNLDELVSREDVLKAVRQCGVCIEPAAGEGRDSFGHRNARQVSNEYGFGSFQFSVAECANCLGPTAEPRHVFAALRRLQNVGEIDFNLDTNHSGRGINVRLKGLGVDEFGTPSRNVTDLALKLYESFNATVKASASKVLQIDTILRKVSLSEEPYDRGGTVKSKTLCLFQRLTKNYFLSETEMGSGDEDIEIDNCGSFDSPPKTHELVRDLEPVLLYLEETDRASQFVDRLKLDDPNNKDFAALSATKFLHGLVPSTLDLNRCRAHHLFGRYQRTKFTDLHQAIFRAVTKGTP